jgi:hypothetical protein
VSQPISLEDLISAVAGAVIEAQDKVHLHQIALIRHYFDATGRPICLGIKLPTVKSGEPGDGYDHLNVPLLSIVPANLLQISEFQVAFDVELGDLATAGRPTAGGGAAAPVSEGAPFGVAGHYPTSPALELVSSLPPGLTVGLQSSTPAAKGPMAHMTVKVEGKAPSEGMARLIQQLNARF